MMTIIIATDKFKGSLTSLQAGLAIEQGIKEAIPIVNTRVFPVADGGDGFASVMKHYLDTETITLATLDPLHRPIEASYEWQPVNSTAIIEVAAASGLVLLREEERNPMNASTVGTGILIVDAIDRGARKIILGLGGSATNDAGMGILSAMGFQFQDVTGAELKASGDSLIKINKIIPPTAPPTVSFHIASDVNNTLYGERGAAAVFGPQKGATPAQVRLLDEGLRNIATILEAALGRNISAVPGLGAAGGIAAGLQLIPGTTIASGFDMVGEASKIRLALQQADLVITGEGRLDEQSLGGKLVGRIASLAREYGIDCMAVCGSLALEEAAIHAMGLKKVLVMNDGSVPLNDLMKEGEWYLKECMRKTFLGMAAETQRRGG